VSEWRKVVADNFRFELSVRSNGKQNIEEERWRAKRNSEAENKACKKTEKIKIKIKL